MPTPFGFVSAAVLVGVLLLQGTSTTRTCRFEGVPENSQCVLVRVRESSDNRSNRTIELRIVVLEGRGQGPSREPLLVLQGGPGVPGTLMARTFWNRQPLRERRDLIFVDQRGTSGPDILNCAFLGRTNFLGALLPRDHVAACRDRLEARADLGAYTMSTSADDLEAIRMALGVESWSLYAVSFGTRLAQTYAKRYPARVRSVILDGVVPFDADLTGDLAESMEAALAWVTHRCEKDVDCRRRYPDTRLVLERLAMRLDSAPVPISITDSLGTTLTGRFGRWDLAYAVRGMLYNQSASSIPAWAHTAFRTGDVSKFARVYLARSRWVGDSSSVPLHLGVYCSEDIPFSDSASAVRRARRTFIGPSYYLHYRAGCAAWPMPRASAEMRQPWRSDIPTLLFSGERDPVTPPRYAERVAQHLTRSRHIVIPGGGHADQTICKTQVMAAFLNDPRRGVTGTTCLDALDFPGFVIQH